MFFVNNKHMMRLEQVEADHVPRRRELVWRQDRRLEEGTRRCWRIAALCKNRLHGIANAAALLGRLGLTKHWCYETAAFSVTGYQPSYLINLTLARLWVVDHQNSCTPLRC